MRNRFRGMTRRCEKLCCVISAVPVRLLLETFFFPALELPSFVSTFANSKFALAVRILKQLLAAASETACAAATTAAFLGGSR